MLVVFTWESFKNEDLFLLFKWRYFEQDKTIFIHFKYEVIQYKAIHNQSSQYRQRLMVESSQ